MDQLLYEELRVLKSDAVKNKESRVRFLEEMERLTEREKAEFARKSKLDDELDADYRNEFRGVKGQKGKLFVLEYQDYSQSFMQQTMFLAMQNYMFDRFRRDKVLTDDEKASVSKFLGIVFDHTESNHVDSVYDVFIKPHLNKRYESMSTSSTEQVNPAYISDAKVKHFGQFDDVELTNDYNIAVCKFGDATDKLVKHYSSLVRPISLEEMQKLKFQERWFIRTKTGLVPMPSYSQLRNSYNYFSNKFEEHRQLANIVFGTRPNKELLVHVHGMFDSMEQADEYRVKNSSNIHDRAVVAPVGFSVLAGDFRCNHDGVVMYNPSDPDVEIMLNGKHNIRRAEAKVMKKRTISKLSKRAPPETLNAIRNFNKAKERLETEAVKNVKEKYKGNELNENLKKIDNATARIDEKINDALQFLDSDEVVLNTLKAKGGKIVKGDDLVVKLE